MNIARLLVTLLALCFFFSGCSKKGPESAAKEFCSCSKPLFDKMNTVNDAMSKGDFSALQSMSQEMQGLMPKMEACMNKLEEKYGDLKDDKEFSAAVEKEIDKLCPNPMKNMGAKMMGGMPPMGMPPMGMPGK